MKVLIRLLAGAATALAMLSAHADVPDNRTVLDAAQVLDDNDIAIIEQKIEQMEASGGPSVVVLTVPSLDGQDPDAFFIHQAEEWGHPGNPRGVLIGIAKAERKIRFEVSHTLDAELPSGDMQAVAREVMAPRLRAGDYAGGIEAAMDIVEARTTSSAVAPSSPDVASMGTVSSVTHLEQTQAEPAPLQTVSDTLQNVLGITLPVLGLIAAVILIFRKVYGDEVTTSQSAVYREASGSMSSTYRSRVRRRDDDLTTTAAAVYLTDSVAAGADSPTVTYSDSSGGGGQGYSDTGPSTDYTSSGSDY